MLSGKFGSKAGLNIPWGESNGTRMHAAPVAETPRRAIPADQLHHHSPAMDWHNKDTPKNKGDDLMLGTTGLPGNLDEYLTFSQIAQAEGLKFGVEHFRRRKPRMYPSGLSTYMSSADPSHLR